MKKLIGLFAILLITSNVFAQINFGSWSNIQTTDTKNNTVEDGIRNGNNGNFNWIPDIHIMRDRFIYMVAYEPITSRGCYDNTTRVVNLYCKDTTDLKNPWVVVCDSIFVGRYTNWNDYEDVDFFKYDTKHNTSHSNITMNRGNLVISLDIHTMKNNCVSITHQGIILKRKHVASDGILFYTVK
jgi:hypothetical protein